MERWLETTFPGSHEDLPFNPVRCRRGPLWIRTARSVTARFGAAANPLADARGSDRSPDREGGVAPMAQHHTVTALAGVYCEWRHSKNAETAKALLLNLVGCGFSLRTRITPLGVGNTTLIEANAFKT